MMKYILFTAMILAAPIAFAQQDDTIATGSEHSHVETHDTTSTTSQGTMATHDTIESHQQSDGDNTVTPSASSTSIDDSTTTTTHNAKDDTQDNSND